MNFNNPKRNLNQLLMNSFVSLSVLWPLPAWAGSINIVNWNVEQGSVENVIRRKQDFTDASDPNGGFGIPDILILQEVNSVASVQKIAEFVGMDRPHIAISDFGDDSEIIFFGFEVAVASRIPIESITEFQHERTSTGRPNRKFEDGPFWVKPDGTIDTLGQSSIADIEVPKSVFAEESGLRQRHFRVTRGLLRVELENGLVIYPVHFKSNNAAVCFEVDDEIAEARSTLKNLGRKIPSYDAQFKLAGDALDVLWLKSSQESLRDVAVQRTIPAFSDAHLDNAVKRENAAAALAALVAQDLTDANKTVIVAGDFNTPLMEPSKSGTDLVEDCVPTPLDCETGIVPNSCQPGTGPDGFDDTHHIMQSGVVSGITMYSMMDPATPTYANDGFQPSPIDNIYISGRLADEELAAERVGRKTPVIDSRGAAIEGKFTVFGSDHYPLKLMLKLQ